jgi:hypothetical protein
MKRNTVGKNGFQLKSGFWDVAAAMPEQGNEGTKQQGAELNAWEDEGGKTAASASTHGSEPCNGGTGVCQATD